MAQVTIAGSKITPTTFLAPGARITVERTRYIDNLLRRGYVDLITVHEDAVPPVDPQPVDEAPAPEPVPVGPPAESAGKSLWAEFLISEGVEYPADATKAQMIEAWKNHGESQPVD